MRGLALWVVVLGSAVAHLGLAGLYAAAVASGRVGGIVGWLLAAVWIALAAWLVQNWLCFRWRIVLAPVTAAVLLALAGRWLAR